MVEQLSPVRVLHDEEESELVLEGVLQLRQKRVTHTLQHVLLSQCVTHLHGRKKTSHRLFDHQKSWVGRVIHLVALFCTDPNRQKFFEKLLEKLEKINLELNHKPSALNLFYGRFRIHL